MLLTTGGACAHITAGKLCVDKCFGGAELSTPSFGGRPVGQGLDLHLGVTFAALQDYSYLDHGLPGHDGAQSRPHTGRAQLPPHAVADVIDESVMGRLTPLLACVAPGVPRRRRGVGQDNASRPSTTRPGSRSRAAAGGVLLALHGDDALVGCPCV